MTNISFYSLKVVKESSGRYDAPKQVNSPKDCYKIAKEVIKLDEMAEENLWLCTLDMKNHVTGLFLVSQGSISSSIVHPRELFKRAILQNAAAIIIFHNHPSGDPSPSKEDINLTTRLKECGKLLGIELLDHLVIGDNIYVSLKEKGYL